MCLYLSCLFFFQAEDGIRALVRSRGLGDVYKRQAGVSDLMHELAADDDAETPPARASRRRSERSRGPVSYTHLTLPTSDLV